MNNNIKNIVVHVRAFSAIFALFFGASCIETRNATHDEYIYYRNQLAADTDLTLFDIANPNCQLWTNWQKMCARLDAQGGMHCVVDPGRPARPSTPFCVAGSKGHSDIALTTNWSRSMLQSIGRYCEDKNPGHPTAATAIAYCQFKTKRPFGDRLAAAGKAHKLNWRSDRNSDQLDGDRYYRLIRDINVWCGRPSSLGSPYFAGTTNNNMSPVAWNPHAAPVYGT